ncbi:hypothetical protein V6N13_053955 [Hibiscus sabdariffa]|uniref:Uncharacterized protein n=1 Tax=Hibiscus sabdariffa TaxID=183260 RepID=A0ABR2T6W5_9ROSI
MGTIELHPESSGLGEIQCTEGICFSKVKSGMGWDGSHRVSHLTFPITFSVRSQIVKLGIKLRNERSPPMFLSPTDPEFPEASYISHFFFPSMFAT